MEAPSKQQIRTYLKENHHITPDQLFRPDSKYQKETHEILNDTFKHFTGHWIEFDGILITQNPQNKLEIIHYKNYTNFLHINSLDDLQKDMKMAIKLNEEQEKNTENRLSELQNVRKSKTKNLDL